MLPAFHRERIAAAGDVMRSETDARAGRRGAPATRFDLYALDARAGAADRDARAVRPGPGRPRARRSTPRASSSRRWASRRATTCCRSCAGRGTPWRRMTARPRAARRADLRGDRRAAARPGERGEDILSRCCSTRDRRGRRQLLSDEHIRDEVMTLLFAGHDTTTSTVAFLFYELARNPRTRVAEPDARGAVDELAGARAGDGARRDAAPVPAGVDRPAPLDRAVRASPATTCPAACPSTTARGPATACPTCGRTPTRSGPSASRPGQAASASPRAPTSRSAAARARASACASASPRSA